MLKIYGADLSAPANKVRMTANALGIEYEYIRVSIRDGENRTEEYLKMHPAGKVPVIDDDGFVLFFYVLLYCFSCPSLDGFMPH